MITARSKPNAVIAAALAAGVAVLVSCRAGGGASVERVNDQLRRKALELEDRVAVLQGENAELAAKLVESERARSGALPKDVLEAIPRCVGVTIGGLSGLQPAKHGSPAMVIVDVEPTDAHGRFVQIVGTLTVEARALPAVGSGVPEGAPITAVLTPAQVREAYRAGVMGPRYTVELPAGEMARRGDLIMRISFSDALTGRVLTAELTRPIPAPRGED